VQTRLEIASLHRRLKATMVYVTHDQVEAMTLADKIVVLNAGRVEQIGSPMELYNEPENIFVAGFIGSPQMNFINSQSIELGAKPLNTETIGIRPEHLQLSRDSGKLKGTIVHVEHLGADTIIYIETEENGRITARLFGEHRYSVDEVVYLTPDDGKVLYFNEAGERIALT
jgi:multiple sugar transport system ATP-binding protein